MVKFYQLVLKRLSGNEILTSVGYNCAKKLILCNNQNLDIVNINAYANFVHTYFMCARSGLHFLLTKCTFKI